MDDWQAAAAAAEAITDAHSLNGARMEEPAPTPDPPPDPIPPPPVIPPPAATLEARVRILQLTLGVVIGLELLGILLVAGIAARLYSEPR